ncbi:lipoprotein [Spiroplasma citri]|uniref:lipoprotein n=1 Tax=Spiroplasma citri TaxID=2133 RepID=UPI00241285E9|nr:lipoprotein [Spiroplasma citri]WFG98436.1 lipoprotein [Spiroplasma citri]
MKKILSLLGTITLIGTSTTSLVACNTQYSEEELKELKEKNKINTTKQEIKDNLEWIAPQEKPFNQVDNKYYFVVWRSDEKDNWRIIKFQNINFSEKRKVLDTQ